MSRIAIVVLVLLSTCAQSASEDAPKRADDTRPEPGSSARTAHDPQPPAAALQGASPDLRDSICLMIESAARAHDLPLEFFARVIWQESRFQPDAVGPRTRSGERAQGIAQFMPRHRGRARPARSVRSRPGAAEVGRVPARAAQPIRQSRAGGGRLQCRPAAACATGWRARRTLPAETRNYVLAITGLSVDEWAAGGKREPAPSRRRTARSSMALLHRAPNPFVQKLEERVNAGCRAVPGACSSAPASRAIARSRPMPRSRSATRTCWPDAIPALLSNVLRTRGTRAFYQVRVGADTRDGRRHAVRQHPPRRRRLHGAAQSRRVTVSPLRWNASA